MSLSREDLFVFFHDRVTEAAAARESGLHGATRAYIAQVLTELGRTERLWSEDAPDTLAELHVQAACAHRTHSIRLYRELGDRSLYLSGYFPDSLTRRGIGTDYYADMGGAAYARVADMGATGPRDPWNATFRELAIQFRHCVDLVADIADRLRADGTTDVVELYEHWVRTGSPHAERRMAELGLLAGMGEGEG